MSDVSLPTHKGLIRVQEEMSPHMPVVLAQWIELAKDSPDPKHLKEVVETYIKVHTALKDNGDAALATVNVQIINGVVAAVETVKEAEVVAEATELPAPEAESTDETVFELDFFPEPDDQ